MQNRIFKGTARAILVLNGCQHFVYHSTSVVIVKANGHIHLDSGGYRTATTKRAMNQASNQFELGFRVFQRAGDWFVYWPKNGAGFEEQIFNDGMILTSVPCEVPA